MPTKSTSNKSDVPTKDALNFLVPPEIAEFFKQGDAAKGFAEFINITAHVYSHEFDYGVMTNDMGEVAKLLTDEGIEMIRALDRLALLTTEKK